MVKEPFKAIVRYTPFQLIISKGPNILGSSTLAHVFNHQTHHRGQVSTSGSPGTIFERISVPGYRLAPRSPI